MFRVSGFGFQASGFGFGFQVSGFGVSVLGSGFREPRNITFGSSAHTADYRGTSLTINGPTLAPCSRFMSRALWWS